MKRESLSLEKTGRALVALPERGRQIVRRIPDPIQLELRRVGRHSASLAREVMAGLLVVGLIAVVIAYARLNKGPISLTFLAAPIEAAINRELIGLSLKIDDAVIQRTNVGAGVRFRLKNVRLIDDRGDIVAQSPEAALGLSGRALLKGQIAPGSVDFIGARLLVFHTDDRGLSLTFSNTRSHAPPRQTAPSTPGVDDGRPGEGAQEAISTSEQARRFLDTTREISLVKTIVAAFDDARAQRSATSYLTNFGVRDAVVVFDQSGDQSFWRVPDFRINLEHRQSGSRLAGEGRIASGTGPWGLRFETEYLQKQRRLSFNATISDLIPAGLSTNLPGLGFLSALNMPVNATAALNVSPDGEIIDVAVKLDLSAGEVRAPWQPKSPIGLDRGELSIRYKRDDGRIEVLPSKLQWGASRATLAGAVVPRLGASDERIWDFRFDFRNALLDAQEFGIAPRKVESWYAEGAVDPSKGALGLKRFHISVDGATVDIAGIVIDAPGSPEIAMRGKLSAMSVSTFKQLWPGVVASNAREWVGERVSAGEILNGGFKIRLPAGALAQLGEGGDIAPDAVHMRLNTRGLVIHYKTQMPPIRADYASLQINGRSFALDMPQSHIRLEDGNRILLTGGQFAIDDLRVDPPTGRISFKAFGDAPNFLTLLDHKPDRHITNEGLSPDQFDGSVEGDVRIDLPLLADLEFTDIKLNGHLRVSEAAAPKLFGEDGLDTGLLNIRITERALDLRGTVHYRKVPFRVAWQRIFGARANKQPSLRLSANLSESDRTRLGLDINHAVRGRVPLVVSVTRAADNKRTIVVQADLGNAEVILSGMAWRKEPGRTAFLQFELEPQPSGYSNIKDFRIAGDDIAVRGDIKLGPDRKPVEFYFPSFSFNIITHLEIKGRLRPDNVWDVSANGTSYDGRQFFRSLFSAGELSERKVKAPTDGPGVDLVARLDTMVGFTDTTVRDVEIILKKRKGELTELDARGLLQGQSKVAVVLRTDEENRKELQAEAADAGAAFRLIGFYPRVEGGEARLVVNLTGLGDASTTGTLWARNFNVYNDRVVNELIQTLPEESSRHLLRQRQAKRRRVVRDRILFEQLRVPFSVGHGQFVLHDSYINGPLLGATMRGRVDFKAGRINLGGTYIPLYGLNSAFGALPIIGNILVGRQGEGLLGITFGIKGAISNPQTIVNPVSLVAPGVFRQIFDFAQSGQRVIPREQRRAN